MRQNREYSEDKVIAELLKSNRRTRPDQSEARIELERRRLMVRLESDSLQEQSVGWFASLKCMDGRPLAFAAAAGFAIALLIFIIAPIQFGGADAEIVLSGNWQLAPGDAISSGAQIKVPKSGNASISMDDGSSVWAASGTSFSVVEESGSRLRIDSGHVIAKVAKKKKGESFEIEVNGATIRVHGTLFSVKAAQGRTEVMLYEGRVQVFQGNSDVFLDPGQRVVIGAKGKLHVEAFSSKDAKNDARLAEYASLDLIEGSATEDIQKGIAIKSNGKSATKGTILDEMAVEESKKLSRMSSGNRDRKSSPGAGKYAAVKKMWEAKLYREIVEFTNGDSSDARIGYYRAKALCRLKRWKECGQQFRVVAKADASREAEVTYLSANAFVKARDYRSSLQMATKAISLGGPTADHAWKLLMRGYLGSGKYKEASQAASKYLAAHPSGVHAAEAYFTQATWHRIDNAWSAAATEYGKFLSRRTGSFAMRDDASFYYGYCTLRTDKVNTGRRAIERYLSGFPGGRHVDKARKILAE